jgi:hypothetical protein
VEKRQTMSEKPQKRLVGWEQYIGKIAKKGITYAVGTLCGGVGLAFLLLAYWGVDYLWRPGGDNLVLLMVGGSFAILGLEAIWGGKTMFSKANKIEAVAPITRYNTGQLPEVETLVRGSDRPPTDHQAELVRAAGQRPETPAEELLRAGQESDQDI